MKNLESFLERPSRTVAQISSAITIASSLLLGAALNRAPHRPNRPMPDTRAEREKMRNLVLSLSFALVLVLGGCAGGVSTVASSISQYSFDEFVLASDGRDTIVVVRGNPFEIDQKTFEKAVTDAMQGQNFGPRTNFTTAPTENAKKEFKVVILFNGSETVLADNLCKAPQMYGSQYGAKGLHVTAAYCWEDESLTEVDGWAGAVAGADSPVFASLIGQITLELFSTRDDDDDHDSGGKPH